MFNRGKSNQESSKKTGWNRSSICFRDPVVEQIPCLCGKKRGKELEIVLDPFLANHFIESLRNNILSQFGGVFN